MNSNKNTYVTIDMTTHGLKTIVTTTQKKINWYLDDYRNTPDHSFASGQGKRALMNLISQNIINLDSHIDYELKNGNEIDRQLWNDFLEDCIVYATLHSYLSGKPLPIIDKF